MLGIIGAMDVEVNALKSMVNGSKTTTVAGIDFVLGTIYDTPVCIAQCSIGKVNAALCTQLMIDKFNPDCIINVGVGCSLSREVVIKNIVVATEVCEYDMDITALGDERGYLYGIDRIKIETDPELSAKLTKSAVECGETVHRGCIASGDAFIATQQAKDFITENFGAIAGEMEGGAIGHVCCANNVPFTVIRSISDGGDEEASMDYPAFKAVAADICTRIMANFIKAL